MRLCGVQSIAEIAFLIAQKATEARQAKNRLTIPKTTKLGSSKALGVLDWILPDGGDFTQITRTWAMPNGNTFTIAPIREIIRRCCREAGVDAVIIDPFANSSGFGTVTNDLNPEFDTDYNMDALEFLRTRADDEADLVLYDPPYSITQAAQLYNSYGKEKLDTSVSNMAYWASCKDEIARITKYGGVVICCGWNTNGCGINRGFTMEQILIVAHGGSKNDTLITVERKTRRKQLKLDLEVIT